MKKPFFPSSVTGAARASVEPNLSGNFDATNAVEDASCARVYEATVVRPGSAQRDNTLCTLRGNPEPPEACFSTLNLLTDIVDQLRSDNVPDDILLYLSHGVSLYYSYLWNQSPQPHL